jgi:chromosomal replication initiation ATPase DnaA
MGGGPMSELRSVLSAPATQGALGEMVDAVAAVYRVPAADLLGRVRTKALTEARACVCLLARRCTRMSYPEIGEALGKRHHTTIMSCENTAQHLANKDAWFAGALAELCERFGEMREEERMQ